MSVLKITRKIKFIHVNTKNKVIDIFTKALSTNKLRRFFKMFAILEVDLSLRGNVKNSSSTN